MMNALIAMPAANVPQQGVGGSVSQPDLGALQNREEESTQQPLNDFAGHLSKAAAKTEEAATAEPVSQEPTKVSEREEAKKPDDLAIACSAQIAVFNPAPTQPVVDAPKGETVSAVQAQGSRETRPSNFTACNSEENTTAPDSGVDSFVSNHSEIPNSAPISPADSPEPKVEAAKEGKIALPSEFEVIAQPVELNAEATSTVADSQKDAPSKREPDSSSRAANDKRDLPISRLQAATSLRGTAAAKQDVRMNYAVEMDETAGQTEKNLPGDAFASVFPPARANVPNDAGSSLRRDVETAPAVLNVVSLDFHAQPESKVENASPSMSAPAVDRVARAVFDGVAHLRQTSHESVTVSITPQPGTELLLRVEMRDGAMSAHLQFEQGDRQFMDSNWQELQRRMADQGVQLHRSDSESHANTSHFQQDFSQSQRRDELPNEETIPLTPPMRGAMVPDRIAAPRFSKSLLESWA